MTPTDFQSTWSKVNVKMLVLIPSAVYSLRPNYQLQSIEMQHLKKSSFILPSNHADKTISSILFVVPPIWNFIAKGNPFEFCTGGGELRFHLFVVENDTFQFRPQKHEAISNRGNEFCKSTKWFFQSTAVLAKLAMSTDREYQVTMLQMIRWNSFQESYQLNLYDQGSRKNARPFTFFVVLIVWHTWKWIKAFTDLTQFINRKSKVKDCINSNKTFCLRVCRLAQVSLYLNLVFCWRPSLSV